ncbi:MAG: HlyD family efflux transporter periplasmic adaptor subunit [Polyangiaceae bacterium]|nr:HlyD family efflux transporter periplasmic adaptor subunit [Polyangiaceae bacterium]
MSTPSATDETPTDATLGRPAASDVLRAVQDPAVTARRRRAQTRKRWLKRTALVVVAASVVAALFLATRPRPVTVETLAVTRGPLQITVEEAGRTRVRDRYLVLAPLSGDLARITLRPGDKVEHGGLLARIVPQSPGLLDPRSRAEAVARVSSARSAAQQAEANVVRAELALEHARGDAERLGKLAASGSLATDEAAHAAFEAKLRAQELTSARFGAEVASHEVGMVGALLARYGDASKGRDAFEIRSPIAGRVLRVLQASAGAVSPSAPLLELGDPTELEVVVDVLTEDAVRIPPRARVVLERWGGPQPLTGHVRLVEPSAFTRVSALGVEEQRVSVVIDFDDPLARRAELGDGYRVEARIVTWQTEDTIVVPASAVFRNGDGWAAFVVANGTASLRPVQVGRRGTFDIQIDSGLNVGDRVIVHPSEKVRDGVRTAAP